PGVALRAQGALADAVLAHFGAHGLARRLLRYIPSRPQAVPDFAAFVSGETAQAEGLSERTLHAVYGDLARGLAAEHPTLWIVEDLHFGAPPERGVLLALARLAGDLRLLVVATARPGLPVADLS